AGDGGGAADLQRHRLAAGCDLRGGGTARGRDRDREERCQRVLNRRAGAAAARGGHRVGDRRRRVDRGVRGGDGARCDPRGFRVLLIKDACGSGTIAMHQTGILDLANRLNGGAVATAEGACRLIAGETTKVWVAEKQVPILFSYEDAERHYR